MHFVGSATPTSSSSFFNASKDTVQDGHPIDLDIGSCQFRSLTRRNKGSSLEPETCSLPRFRHHPERSAFAPPPAPMVTPTELADLRNFQTLSSRSASRLNTTDNEDVVVLCPNPYRPMTDTPMISDRGTQAVLEKHRNERLRDQEQQRQDRQRLDDILQLCAEFERSESLRSTLSSATSQKLTSQEQTSYQEDKSATQAPTTSTAGTAAKTTVASSTHEASSSSEVNKSNGSVRGLDQKMQQPDDGVLTSPEKSSNGGEGATTANESKVEDDSSSSVESSSTASSPQRNNTSTCQIITNGSLDRLRNTTNSRVVAPTKRYRPTSSEDELSGINSPGPSYVASLTMRTVPVSSATAAALSTVDNSLFNLSQSVSKMNTALGVTSQLTTDALATPVVAPSKSPNTNVDKWNDTRSPAFKAQRAQLYRDISKIKHELLTLEASIKETMHELQMELALVKGELCDEEFSLKEDLLAIKKLQQERDLLVRESEAARQQEFLQLDLSRERISKWQRLTSELGELLQQDPTALTTPFHRDVEERYQRELETLESERKLFEDLEFRQLELEARREEDLESVVHRTQQACEACELKKARIAELTAQQKSIMLQMQQEKAGNELEQRILQSQLQKAQQHLDTIDAMMRSSLLEHRSKNASLDYSSESSDSGASDSDSDEYSAAEKNAWNQSGVMLGGDKGSESSSMMEDRIESSSSEHSIQHYFDASTATPDIIRVHQIHAEPRRFRQSSTDSGVVLRSNPNRQPTQRPLTRYLPVFDGDLDLKRHLELAGHQVDQCKHVIVTSTSCRGYLQKLSGAWRQWRKRWFVFDREARMLHYFVSRNETKRKGVISFQAIEEVYVEHGKGSQQGMTFCLKCTNRGVMQLSAPTPETMRIWVDVLITGAQAYFTPYDPNNLLP